VTFLFTDIEGSTRLWERHPVAMQTAVTWHVDLLRRTCATHRGVLYKTVGDGTQAAFAAAPDAVAAALAAQVGLRAAPCADALGPLLVRMAVHAGEAEPRANDYLAAPLNRLTRLHALARGGQILLTEASYLLVRDALPAGASLRDLGEVRLRDLERVERTFALVHASLPDEAPLPLHERQALRNGPPTLTAFLGRTAELAATKALLASPMVRLVTLTGPGGIGKSRLGLQVAQDLVRTFRDGVIFVDLAPLRDSDLVPTAIAAAIGLRETPGRSVCDVLVEYLAPRQILLLLDNFEHLLDGATVVADLLAAAEQVKVLVASRAPLGLRGEHEFSVPALGLPELAGEQTLNALAVNEAVAFFTDRARIARPDFVLSEETAPMVAKICRQLDGLPLALELAAARLKMLTPAALLARLEQRLPLLTGGPRDAPLRQRTLRATIAWSYDLLTPAEQTLFMRLGIFTGGWDLDAVQAIMQPMSELDVFDGLTSLVDESLVQRDESAREMRFALLETVREFALERLRQNGGQEQSIAAAHAGYFLALTESARLGLVGIEQDVWLDRLDREDANIRAALTWTIDTGVAESGLRFARALWRYWTSRGRLVEGRSWLERALALPDVETASPVMRADAHNALGNLLGDIGEYPAARQHYEAALALRRGAEDTSEIAGTLNNLGTIAAWLGEYNEAVALYEQSLAIVQTRSDPFALALALSNLGDVRLAQGDFAEAWRLQVESLHLREQAKDALGCAYSIYNLGEIARLRGNRGDADQHLCESLRRFTSLGDRVGTAYAEWSLADLASLTADMASAAEFLDRAFQTRLDIGDKRGVIECLETLGIAAIRAQIEPAGIGLLSCAGAQREVMSCPVPPSTAAAHARDLEGARTRLGATAVDQLLHEGRLITPAQAFSVARDTLRRLADVTRHPLPESASSSAIVIRK
jgi:predicted ATPase/class 3 adenylate cyclase